MSTIAGLGGFFVTGWQSKAQITARYGALADAVLSGHRSKIIFNGTDDPATLEYATRIAGTVHINQHGTSTDGTRRTVNEHPQREDLLPAHVIRQMRRTDAVLFHGTLPPVHLRLVRWWKTKELCALVPHGSDGRPLPPPADGTCPVAERRTSEVAPVIDKALVAEQLANLPRPKSAREVGLAAALASSRRADAAPFAAPRPKGQGTLDFSATAAVTPASATPSTIRNRVAGRCAVCRRWVEVGAGTNRPYGTRTMIVYDPPCDADSQDTPAAAAQVDVRGDQS